MVGNEVRLKILYLLEEENGGLCVCDISDILEMTVPAVSQHLKKLKVAGIIEPKREGQTIFYSLNERNIDIIRPLFTHIKIGNKTKQVTY